MTTIYLGGAIDFLSGSEYNWRKDMSQKLMKAGMTAYDPSGAFAHNVGGTVEQQRAVVEINKKALANCDIALFVMYSKIPSVGTPIELMMAHQMGIKTVVIWDPHEKSWDGAPSPKEINYCRSTYVLALADVLETRFDRGLKAIELLSGAFNHSARPTNLDKLQHQLSYTTAPQEHK